jgi:hypothetical protein
MKQTVNFSLFCDSFVNRKGNFSYSGLRALFDYFESLEEDGHEEIKLDPIAICCDFTEHQNLEELNNDLSDN